MTATNEPHQIALPGDIKRQIRLSWLALLVERFWPALWPSTGIIGVFIIVAMVGGFHSLPGGIHMLALIAFAGAFVVSVVWSVRGQSIPTRTNALRHLERSSGLEHRPITGLEDQIGLKGGQSEIADVLWRAHRQQLFQRIRDLKVTWPTVDLSTRDRYAIRMFILLVLIASVIYAGPEAPARLAAAFDTRRSEAPWAQRGDAWIKPPAYTGEPSRALALGPPGPQAPVIEVPKGSTLHVRIHRGGGVAVLRTGPLASAIPDPQAIPFFNIGEGEGEAKATIDEDLNARLTVGGLFAGNWRLKAIADTPPSLTLKTPIAVMQSQTLRFHYEVKDDYGVQSARASITLQGQDPKGPKAGAALSFDLPLPPKPAREGESTVFKDLTSHRWAGLPVTITLTATDALGQTSSATPIKLTLPERHFSQPLARALIEQRRTIVRNPAAKDRVAKILEGLSLFPELFAPDHAVYLGMRVAHYRLTYARPGDDLSSTEQLLWDLALQVEEGVAADAQAELRRIQQQLAKALSEGASDAQIAQLMQQLRMAIQNFVQAVQANGARSAQTIPGQMTRELHAQDLKAMLDQVETLARSGSPQAAQQLLSQLQATLESLQSAGSPANPKEQAAANAADGLRALIEQQSQLMDKTFREQSNNADGAAKVQRGQALAGDQERLNQALGDLMKQMQAAGADVKALEGAHSAMQAAAQNLREGALGDAQTGQGKALESLRQGGEALARAMQALASQRAGQGGGQGMGAGENTDPLGRQGPNFGPQSGDKTKVPTKLDIQRAREILEELQRRASERSRPEPELEYLERLLRRF